MSHESHKQEISDSRVPMADSGPLSDSQREIYEKIVAGKRGKVVGPLRVALHSAELADRWQALGEFLRFGTGLPKQISELAIITTGRFWNCQLEWLIHSGAAADAGLPADTIESIRRGQPPIFDDPLHRAVYEFTREQLQYAQVDDRVYEDARKLLGDAPLVELTAVIGYYSMVAMTLNIHRVPLPANERGSLLDLPTGNPLLSPSVLPPSTGREQLPTQAER